MKRAASWILSLWTVACFLNVTKASAATFAPTKEERAAAVQRGFRGGFNLTELPHHTDEEGRTYVEVDDMKFVIGKGDATESAFTGNRWTNGIVYYVFDSAVTSANRQNWRDAAAAWTATAALTFTEGTGIGNYIYVQNGSGNNSYVGMIGGQQAMNIYNWTYRYIVGHEIGHALGLVHEHQRSDRDSSVTIAWSYIQSGYESNFQTATSTNYGTYDFDSVMHYDKCSFSTDCAAGSTCGCTHYTIVVLAPNDTRWQNAIGQRDHLSQLDGDGMAQRYGPPGGGVQTQELLSNGNFESAYTGWSVNGNCTIYAGSYPHTGNYYGYLANADNAFGNLFNSNYVTIPANATSVTLSFWLNVTSQETTNTSYDTMNVTLLLASGGSVPLATYSEADRGANQPGNPYYIQRSFDVTGYRGQGVKIYFDATTDSSLPTIFRIDDLSLSATIPSTQNYTITTSSSPSNGGTTSGGGTFAGGTSHTVTATVNSGYTFTNWTENGNVVSNSASYTFTLNSNRTLAANFTPITYSIATSSSPSNGGTTTGGGTFAAGTSQTVTATANSGYTFSNWTESGNVVSASSSYTFTLNSNRTLVANFAVINYTITTSSLPSNGGTTTGGGTFAAGTSQTATATANSGYTFSNWTENASVVSSTASYTFTLNGNRNLVANFTSNQVNPPTVQTLAPTFVSSTSTTIKGTVANDGGAPVTRHYFYYWSDPSLPTGVDEPQITVSGNNFSVQLAALNPNIIYYYRAYAYNSSTIDLGAGPGWGYGGIVSFTAKPEVSSASFSKTNGFTITWKAKAGLTYQIQRSVDPSFNYTTIASGIPGVEPTTQYIDSSPEARTMARVFYRVALQ